MKSDIARSDPSMLSKANKDFIIAFKLYCPKCKLLDFVKVSNIGWQGGKLKDSPCLKKSF